MRKETVAVLEELSNKEKLSSLDRKLLIGACTSNKQALGREKLNPKKPYDGAWLDTERPLN